MTIQQAWNERCRLHAEGDKLYRAYSFRPCAEGDRHYAEGNKLHVEGDLVLINAVIEIHGPLTVIEYESANAVLVNGVRYEYQPETVSCPKCGGTVMTDEDFAQALEAIRSFELVAAKRLERKTAWTTAEAIEALRLARIEVQDEWVRSNRYRKAL